MRPGYFFFLLLLDPVSFLVLISYIFVLQFAWFFFRKKCKSLTLAKKLCVPHFTAGTVDFNSKLLTYF